MWRKMALLCRLRRSTSFPQSSTFLSRVSPLSSFANGRITDLKSSHLRYASTHGNGPSRTPLHDFHVAHGGKMVEFAGFMMPLQYSDLGIADSHRHTRSHCSLFDVSHMVQTRIVGDERVKFIESLTVADVDELDDGCGTLTLFTNSRGGVVDDLICNKVKEGGALYVVSNAGRRKEDLELLDRQVNRFRAEKCDVEVHVLDLDFALLALQGPEMAKVLQPMTNVDLSQLRFMRNSLGDVAGIPNCRVTRCGYTGEDGVEISVPRDRAVELAGALLESKDGDVKLAGLGARDSLRIEAGLCLYGSDLTEETTPVEATLAWTVGKRRRQHGGFAGDDVILAQLSKQSSPRKRRIGLSNSGGRPFRGGAVLMSSEGDAIIGNVTSGVPSPSLPGMNIGMGYVQPKYAKPGTELRVRVGKELLPVKVTKMPFVPTKYFT